MIIKKQKQKKKEEILQKSTENASGEIEFFKNILK